MTDYILTGIDKEGNITLEHPLSADEVIAILAAAVKKTGNTTLPIHVPFKKEEYTHEDVALPHAPEKKKGTGRGGSRALSQEKVDQIIHMRESGKTQEEIRDALHVSSATVWRILKNAGMGGKRAKSVPVKETTSDNIGKEIHHFHRGRGSRVDVGTFQRIKIASSHQIPNESIARELKIDPAEVQKAIIAATYADYTAG